MLMAPAYNETIHGLDGLGACFQDVREGIIGMLREQFVEAAVTPTAISVGPDQCNPP